MELTLDDVRVKPQLPPSRVNSGNDRARVEGWRSELDSFYGTMTEFYTLEIDEILVNLSSFSARMSQIRTLCVRSESRLLNNFRTKEIDPFLDECDRQYKIWSRQQAVRQYEWEQTRGL